MKTIENRADISRLVDAFYAKIREDERLGPIFESHIEENEWPEHLERLTDFWESNLFHLRNFRGSPTQKHMNVDKNLNYTLEMEHFGRWLQLWITTIDASFAGEKAELAKQFARKMATGQYLIVWKSRPENLAK